VMEVARCLTGWTVRSLNHEPYFEIGKVEFKLDKHDCAGKEVLGHKIPAIPESLNKETREQLGQKELDRVLEIVTQHPSTAKHIAAKLCRRFIADDPPASAVDAVADAFTKSRGDIRDTLRALFATTEFWTLRGNKFKRPFNFVASALRATGAE